MRESEPPSVQRLTMKCDAASPPVRGIAHQRMMERREMNADLMRATRFQPALEQRAGREALSNFIVRHGALAGRHNRHRRPLDGMACDRRVDASAVSEPAMNQRKIFAA